MQKALLLSIVLFSFFVAKAQSGKYAGSKASIIGKIFTSPDSIPGLKGWTYYEGAVMNTDPINDTELHLVEVFKKGTTFLIIFSIKEDTAVTKYLIADVVEVKGVINGWSIRTSSCRFNKVFNGYILAWGKDTDSEYMKIIKKAWRINPDKRRIEVIPVKGIDCENIGC
jgi:hypothetical protein